MNNVVNLNDVRKRYDEIYEATDEHNEQTFNVTHNKHTNTVVLTFKNQNKTFTMKLDTLKSVGLMMALENVFDVK